jgi:hypothetical protein
LDWSAYYLIIESSLVQWDFAHAGVHICRLSTPSKLSPWLRFIRIWLAAFRLSVRLIPDVRFLFSFAFLVHLIKPILHSDILRRQSQTLQEGHRRIKHILQLGTKFRTAKHQNLMLSLIRHIFKSTIPELFTHFPICKHHSNKINYTRANENYGVKCEVLLLGNGARCVL